MVYLLRYIEKERWFFTIYTYRHIFVCILKSIYLYYIYLYIYLHIYIYLYVCVHLFVKNPSSVRGVHTNKKLHNSGVLILKSNTYYYVIYICSLYNFKTQIPILTF